MINNIQNAIQYLTDGQARPTVAAHQVTVCGIRHQTVTHQTVSSKSRQL